MFASLKEQAEAWCVGKQWLWRALLLIWFGYVFIGLLKNPHQWNLFASFNLAVHEIGHVLFAWAGEFMHIAGGTLTQLVVPILGMWNFYIQKDFFAITLCFGWLSVNLFDVSVYMADAQSMQLDLVTIGGPVYDHSFHDWNRLFSKLGILPYDHVIAGCVWFLAVLAMLTCFFTGGWLLWKMMFPVK